MSQLRDITVVVPMFAPCCCCSSDQRCNSRQRTSSVFPPLETQTTQFVFTSSFFSTPRPPVDGHVAAIRRCASPVSLSRDAGRLTALMAVKISGKNVDSWESHRQCKGDERESSPLRPLPRKQEGAQLLFIGSPAPQMSPVKHRSAEWARANCAWCRVLSHHVFLLAPLAVCL